MTTPSDQAPIERWIQRFSAATSSLVARLSDLDPERWPVLSRLPAETRYPAIALALLLFLVLTVGSALWHINRVDNQADWVEVSTRMQMLSQRYAKTAQQAVLGNPDAFTQLEQSRNDFGADLRALIDGGEGVPVPGHPRRRR